MGALRQTSSKELKFVSLADRFAAGSADTFRPRLPPALHVQVGYRDTALGFSDRRVRRRLIEDSGRGDEFEPAANFLNCQLGITLTTIDRRARAAIRDGLTWRSTA